MKTKIFLILIITCLFNPLFGQQGDGGSVNGYNYLSKQGKTIDQINFVQPDIQALQKEDQINDSLKIGPWRFGYNNMTSINFLDHGTWFDTPKGGKIWLLKINCDQAKTINLSFDNTAIPDGNELFVYNPDKSFILGKFTQKHLYKGVLGTELVPGNTVIIEYFVPAKNATNLGNVEISRVTHGYRTAGDFQEKAFGQSGDCNMNVNCPDGSPYQNNIRNSVVKIILGGGLCTGSLINNTTNDGKPYVLTANHCYSGNSNTASWVFRFNYQSSTCPNPSSEPNFESLSGSIYRANRTPSDFCLVEISDNNLVNGTVPQSYNPFFAGWNRGNVAPTKTVGIHHPTGDIKKISFDDDPAIAIQAMGSSEPNSTWQVIWDRNTTTEGGSSGSPLFNQNNQIIGQLWGGSAGCNNLTGEDFYGRIYNSWNPAGSSNSEQLEHWLDPTNSGVSSTNGYDPYNNPLDYDAAILEVQNIGASGCASTVSPKVVFLNNGTITMTSLDIQYSYNGGATQTYNWSGSLNTYQSETVTLPNMTQVNGNNTFSVTLVDPNNQTDQNTANNQINDSYVATLGANQANFKFYLGCYSDEVSWDIKNDNGTILYSGSEYPGPSANNYLVEEGFCLNDGCYELNLYDDYGDGVEGAKYGNCNYSGSLTLTQEVNNEMLAYLPTEQADFGSTKTFDFCINEAGLHENVLANKVKVYPNPSNNLFNINVDIDGEKEIVLYGMTGEKIYNKKTTNDNTQINVSEIASGVYIISITTQKGIIQRKVTVQ